MRGFHSKTAVFVTDWFTLVEKRLADSPSSAPYFPLEMSDYVTVAALTQNDELVQVGQNRPAVGERTLELPSGRVDPGEIPIAAAACELMEETGYIADNIEEIGVIRHDIGRLSNRLWCFSQQSDPPATPGTKKLASKFWLFPRPMILRFIAIGKSMLGLAVMQGRVHTMAHWFTSWSPRCGAMNDPA
jgi:8-oxo-dGTP pyrophosphatase MutT (NUDIX family)